MKTLTFNCSGQSLKGSFSWEVGDKLEITRETKKTVQVIETDGTKRIFYKSLFNEY